MLETQARDNRKKEMVKVRDRLMLLLNSSFQAICRHSKNICRELVVLGKLAVREGQEFRTVLAECMRIIATILQSLQPQKHPNILSPLSHILTKTSLNPQKPQPPSPSHLHTRLLLNQKSPYFKNLSNFEITERQRKFTQNQNLSHVLEDIANGDIVLRDLGCLGCSRVFFRDGDVGYGGVGGNLGEFGCVGDLGDWRGVDGMSLEKYFSAICTQGGGIVIIGSQKHQNTLKTPGLLFPTYTQMSTFYTLLKTSLSNLKPTCNYNIQRILVHTNYLNPVKIAEEEMRVCFRVVIRPVSVGKVCYLSYALKGRCQIFQGYRLGGNGRPVKFGVEDDQSKENAIKSIYTYMHQKYLKTKSKPTPICHPHIKCYQPYQSYSKIFLNYIQQPHPQPQPSPTSLSLTPTLTPSLTQSQSLTQSSTQTPNIFHQQQQNTYQIIDDPQPKFKYLFASLLVTSSKKNQRWVEDYQEELRMRKKVFQLCRPFKSSFKQCCRPVWLITHQLPFVQMKNTLKQLQKHQKIKSGVIKIMPISRNLQIQCQKLTQKYEQIFEKKYKSRYNENYTRHIDFLPTELGKIKTIFFGFNDFAQSVYAYMIFEELQLRPYFVKQGNIYKKKTKYANNDPN